VSEDTESRTLAVTDGRDVKRLRGFVEAFRNTRDVASWRRLCGDVLEALTEMLPNSVKGGLKIVQAIDRFTRGTQSAEPSEVIAALQSAIEEPTRSWMTKEFEEVKSIQDQILAVLARIQSSMDRQTASMDSAGNCPPLDELHPTPVFVGRKAELAALAQVLLSKSRGVVALTGMAGVGKSYLADHFGIEHRAVFPGGFLRMSLHTIETRSTEQLAAELASKLSLTDPKVLPSRLGAGDVLVHVENVDSDEHLRRVVGLLASLRGAAVIVSGRVHPLGRSQGWRQVKVAKFEPATALEYLTCTDCPADTPADRSALEQLAERLGYLPLALALAAGYMEAGHSVESFLGQLDFRGQSLEPVDAAEFDEETRSRKILASSFEISWKYYEQRVGEPSQGLACMASQLRGVFGRDIAQTVAGLDDAPFGDAIGVAVRMSLLELVRTSATEPRYTFHPLLAEFVAAQAHDVASAGLRLHAWLEPRIGDRERRSELVREEETLLDWLVRAPEECVPALSRADVNYGDEHGPFLSWIELHRRASQSDDASGRAQALQRMSYLAIRVGQLDEAWEYAQRALYILQELGDERGVAFSLGLEADVLFRRGNLHEALRIRKERQLPAYERLGDDYSRAITLGKIADILIQHGDHNEALRIFQGEVLPALERLGNDRQRAVTLGKITDILKSRGNLNEALRI
jgi:tetratricopeptide (TPR) repeat protein